MAIETTRLDRFLAKKCQINRKSIRLILAQKRVCVDGDIAQNIDQLINTFSYIELDGQVVQNNQAHYLMLNKPIGVVSATKDNKHPTVLDLLSHPDKQQLHIVGRLDLNTSGLMLLTNDSRWSEKLTLPEHKVSKNYLVTLENKLTDDYIDAFAQGMYFSFEGLTTKPAKLVILSDYQARVTLIEGRYHQIKRMFGRFQNKVVALHRESIGELALDQQLKPGMSRALSAEEVAEIFQSRVSS